VWFSAAPQDGLQAAFIQNFGTIQQDITDFDPTALYTLSVYVTRRPGYGLNPIQITLTDDSNPALVLDLGTVTPSDSASFELYTSATFQPTSSGMTLSFAGTAGGDSDTALDLVSFTDPSGSAPEPVGFVLTGTALVILGRIRFRAGAGRR
jgi:hypothetical protein